MGVRRLHTEQYPKGLGNTTSNISIYFKEKPIEKTSFSCSRLEPLNKILKESKVENILLTGIETHIQNIKILK